MTRAQKTDQAPEADGMQERVPSAVRSGIPRKTEDFGNGMPYRTLSSWCLAHYGEKLYKISLDAGFTCPNRDGTLGSRGCIFCSAGGSGDFAAGRDGIGSLPRRPGPGMQTDPERRPEAGSLRAQLDAGKALLSRKRTGSRFIAYFQAYTNTYGPVSRLERLFSEALSEPDIAGISIATRPDCLPEEVIGLFLRLKKSFPGKFIWVELGLQTIHEKTAAYIRRGYPLSRFDEAVRALRAADIPVIVHVILGLPGETREMMLQTVRYLNGCGIWGVKLQLLHVLEGTDLAADYRAGLFQTLSLEEYLSLLCDCIAALSPEIVIHRVTGDGPKRLLIAPLWSADKRNVLNLLHRRLKQNAIRQGQTAGLETP